MYSKSFIPFTIYPSFTTIYFQLSFIKMSQIIDLTNDTMIVVAQPAKKPRAPPRCGHCRVQGHTIRTCYDPVSANVYRQLYQMTNNNMTPLETVITWLHTHDVEMLRYIAYHYAGMAYKKHTKQECIDELARVISNRYSVQTVVYRENVQASLRQGRILLWAWIEEPGNIPILYRQYCSRDANNPPPTEEECNLALHIIISQNIPLTTSHSTLKRIYEFILYRCDLFTREADATSEDNVIKYGVLRKKIFTPIQIECPICMETKETPHILTTTCGHQFCRDCITTVIIKSTRDRCNCPMCRTPIHKLTLETIET